jgi:Mrp family chromosome partitioning ATPase/capsular polysaccharide biosynthesis protein
MEPVQYLRTIRRRWIVIVVCVVLGLVAGYLTSLGAQKKKDETTYWRATYTLYYDSSAVQDKGGAFTALGQMGLLATSGDVPAKIAQERGVDVNSLSARVQTVTNPALATLKITVTGEDAGDTVALANDWGDSLMQYITDKNKAVYDEETTTTLNRLNSLRDEIAAKELANPDPNSLAGQELDALRNQYRLAYERLQGIAQQGDPRPLLISLEKPEAIPINGSEFAKFVRSGALGDNNITINPADKSSDNLDATLSSSTSSSKIPSGPVPRSLIGGFLGLLVGLAAAFVIERFDNRIQTKEDAEAAFALPVLCEVPPLTRAQRAETEVLSHTHPMSRTAEAYRALRSSLVFLRQTLTPAGADVGDAGRSQVVMVTSAGPSEGKTTTVANLAAVFAEADHSVLVINCDFRRPRVHRYLGGSDEPRKVVQSDIAGVRMVNNVLSNPNPNPAEVAAAQRQVIETARGMFDVILLDTAPLLSTNDASELIGSTDVVVVVAQTGRTGKPAAARATEVLQRLEATVAGVALLGARYIPSAQYYYYATEIGTSGSHSAADSHPLDLLVRRDLASGTGPVATSGTNGSNGSNGSNGAARSNGSGTPAPGAATEPTDQRSGSGAIDHAPATGRAEEPAGASGTSNPAPIIDE